MNVPRIRIDRMSWVNRACAAVMVPTFPVWFAFLVWAGHASLCFPLLLDMAVMLVTGDDEC